MGLFITLLMLAGGSYGVWWVSNTQPELKNKVLELFNVGSFHTLELRYSSDQIMEGHRQELLKDNRHKYMDPVLNFYPYVLLEVKYTLTDEKTSEGVMLWDLTDGEMVIDTKDWQKTHGFGDCINANADKHEFKILNILARKGGTADRENLAKMLHVDNDILDGWIDNCRRKKLVVQSGNKYRLHLENPRLRTVPETHIDERLVTKPFQNAVRLPALYSISQIERMAKAAFGNDFAIRKTTDIYLPVHGIVVQNPDGSVHTSHWNALNGRPLRSSYFIE